MCIHIQDHIHTFLEFASLSRFNHALLMAGRAKMAPFARKGQQVLMTAVPAAHLCKAVVQKKGQGHK